MSDKQYGTHQQRQRPREGWPDVKAPEQKAGRKIRKARERLAKRIKSWEELPNNKKGAYRRPGSLQTD